LAENNELEIATFGPASGCGVIGWKAESVVNVEGLIIEDGVIEGAEEVVHGDVA
jgi:hypothetical protein